MIEINVPGPGMKSAEGAGGPDHNVDVSRRDHRDRDVLARHQGTDLPKRTWS